MIYRDITSELRFYPERGLYRLSDGKEVFIAGISGYVTPACVLALEGRLKEMYVALMERKEWRELSVDTSFVSYEQLESLVDLMQDETVRATLDEEEKECFLKIVRAYVRDVIDREDKLVKSLPEIWFDPAFYPLGIYADDGDFDPYNKYDWIPFGGFAKAAFYFFVANTAKDYLRQAILQDDLLSGAKESIALSKAIFDDLYNVKIQTGLFRSLLEAYLKYCYQQEELRLAHDVTLVEDDLWQEIYDKEKIAHDNLNKHLEKLRLFDLRPLLEVQGDLLTRMRKDHPLIVLDGKPRLGNRNVPTEGDYVGLAEWLRNEKRDNHDWKTKAGGKWTALCKDKDFLRRIGWERCNADSLRHAIHELERKNS